ncbi:MAG: sulfatase [Verrucomicrobia bacterium]|nr:sulfatase [Verrucomicrobiota bacterium]
MKLFTVAATVLLGTLFSSITTAQINTAAPTIRPNIVFVLMDDQRWDDFGFMGHPFARTPHIDRIAREGVRFNNAFVTTPLCSPSRASFLTGQYAHTHGILDNVARNEASHQLVTWPRLLREVGYTTAFVGKWHMGNDDTPRPGFDHWVSVKGQGEYFNPELNIDGKRKQIKNDYITDVFTDYAVDFLKRDYDRPICLFLAHKAVHPDLTQNPDGSLSDPSAGKFTPAERHQKLYANQPIPRRPNFGAPKAKPALQRPLPGLPPLSEKTATDDETVRNRLRMLAAVDESVQRIFEILEDTGKLDNTLFIFTSDGGYFYGEHGLSVERRLAYEESIRIPLLMRFPKLIQPSTGVDAMVLNIDIAPTVLELAGARIPMQMQGRSLLPILQGSQVSWRQSFLIEYFSQTDNVFPRVQNLGYQAVRTDGWKYIHYTNIDNADELYDLRRDPYEQKNLFWEPGAQGPLLKMQMELVQQVRETN